MRLHSVERHLNAEVVFWAEASGKEMSRPHLEFLDSFTLEKKVSGDVTLPEMTFLFPGQSSPVVRLGGDPVQEAGSPRRQGGECLGLVQTFWWPLFLSWLFYLSVLQEKHLDTDGLQSRFSCSDSSATICCLRLLC